VITAPNSDLNVTELQKAYIFPLMISVYLRWNFSGELRNFLFIWATRTFRSFKVIARSINLVPIEHAYVISY